MQLSTEAILEISLPKWPQMRVFGTPVSVEQAKEIILRTDHFLTSIDTFGGGTEWDAWARKELGFVSPGLASLERQALHTATRLLREDVGFIHCNFVHNRWASSSYIYGAYGWCNPSGEILFLDNIGKYPEAIDVLDDWSVLAAAFPFLDLTAVLMSGEHCEESVPVFAIKVSEGVAVPVVAASVVMPERDWGRNLSADLFSGEGWAKSRNGIPSEWVEEYAPRIKAILSEILPEAR